MTDFLSCDPAKRVRTAAPLPVPQPGWLFVLLGVAALLWRKKTAPTVDPTAFTVIGVIQDH